MVKKKTQQTVVENEAVEIMGESVELLREAMDVITGPRRTAYGGPEESFAAIAQLWGNIFGIVIPPRKVALAMIGLKVLRDANAAGHDNLVDIAGYAALAELLEEEYC